MSRFLSREEIHEYYVDQMSLDEQNLYNQFGHLALVRVFDGKLFVIYSLSHGNVVPEILTNLRVTAVGITEGNAFISLLDLKTGKSCNISYMPELLSDYDVFGAMPSECMLSKVFKEVNNEKTFDGGLSAGLLLRHRMKPEFKRAGYIYCVGLSDFNRLFGDEANRAFEKLESTVK